MIISRFFKGIIIALGFIVPGVSGGVLATILGIYEQLLNFMADITKDFKKNFLFFLPVGVGGIVGLGLLSKPLSWALENYQLIVLWGFSGAIIGTVPSLFKESVSRKHRDSKDYLLGIGTFITGFLFFYFIGDLLGPIPGNFIGFVLAGGLIALGVLVPGLSPSNLLLILGLYDPMLEGFSRFDIAGVFIPMFIGGLLILITFSKLMMWFLNHFHSRVYHAIIGLILVSTALIMLPPVASYTFMTMEIGISMVSSFFLGSILGYWMSCIENKNTNSNLLSNKK